MLKIVVIKLKVINSKHIFLSAQPVLTGCGKALGIALMGGKHHYYGV
ncbi:hypothetical protein MUGA111182_01400 [Mucilaginibacter galii]|uniref:Uncharacterized protein n=1 Tax=Mucilaginibacter galii TaxID=2005073 RepID=A0A917N016_9SPHI|nr:hypothetical protein GCM10011425_01010 [Mucilaginibacter galii]